MNGPVYAVLGRPVGRSRSPALHGGWLRALGLPGTYVALEVPEGQEDHVGAAVRALGLAGANVTLPLKERIVAQLDALDATATATGAVNTIVREGQRLVGRNTDVPGFRAALAEAGLSADGRRAAVVGAGGAARAVVAALLAGGAAHVDVIARDPRAAERLAAAFGARVHPAGPEAVAGAQLGVHATSGRPAWLTAARPEAFAALEGWMDLNYWDPDPPGAAAVRARGAVFVDGEAMFLAQAADAFEAWTGRDPRGIR